MLKIYADEYPDRVDVVARNRPSDERDIVSHGPYRSEQQARVVAEMMQLAKTEPLPF